MSDSVRIKWFERPSAYEPIWQAMRAFTELRGPDTPDEIWLVEHTPVYTQGQAGKPEHLLNAGGIPVVQTDRGGQITYHGPGQLMVYCLFDLRRAGLYVKEYVRLLEEAVMACLSHFGVEGACCKPGAPGVYVPQARCKTELAKISALGVKIRNGRSYHGLALNIGMDLKPFGGINPCGYEGLQTTDIASQGVEVSWEQAAQYLADYLAQAITSRATATVA
ncbi:lipoyl(octanoyl) transferase LipB [Alcaligenes ammonioxydans]|jgi:lipoyl(octanoyl) transferase|uniref:Octanoyltransferase n=1 Tax=Alcaligenes ammonioxydans TaxID=2582914 RepID=A0ABX8SQV8_9BURK|nr:lipoyl(octanoyl) transferase LipB [Alcaligenes ammonioxydans]EJC61354.1 lipoate-protein ligase B [Alcaligenes faecalis subsp. faecalis NCIB 8687]QBH19757.1 lipoyl(octanoyl) transferase LipB [Alcaligenes faecalis]MCH1880192.1 lipoyl(octanoyl) transferase LipB [Alcaligenes ammonioxydans]QXX77765.1 lipoyl(octanoyl) transferase LipB [Alcaligenes ammonioxydans]WGQ35813.1 lipoyl(octanoyl) transferase LipB [Alcaligenes faecalis]